MGPSTQAFGNSSVALGAEAAARSSYGIAIGYKAKSTKYTNFANLGLGSQEIEEFGDNYSIAIGVESITKGINAVSLGRKATAYNHSISIGTESRSGDVRIYNAIALGNNSRALNTSSLAIGYGAEALQTSTISIGTGSYAGGSGSGNHGYDREFINAVAIGNTATAKGKNSLSLGTDSYVLDGSDNSIAIGNNAKITGNYATYEDANQNSVNSLAIGSDATVHLLKNSIAIGKSAKATNIGYVGDTGDTIAIGTESYAEAAQSMAIGYKSKSTDDSIAIGTEAGVYGIRSIAIGSGAIAANLKDNGVRDDIKSGTMSLESIAIGYNALASTNNSIAIGTNACKLGGGYLSDSTFVCLGANSGPGGQYDGGQQNYYNNTIPGEHIFIGSNSYYNSAAAVLEVHNVNDAVNLRHEGGSSNFSRTAVVINGNLIVKGRVFAAVGADAAEQPALFFKNKDDSAVRVAGVNGDDMQKFYYHPGLIETYIGGNPYYSDRRLKYVGNENTSGLDKIRQLKVFNYTFKKDEKKTPHVGVIAQDLQKIFPDAVSKAKDGFLKIRFEDMFYAMINAIKELDAKYKAQEQRINELEKRIEQLEAKIK